MLGISLLPFCSLLEIVIAHKYQTEDETAEVIYVFRRTSTLYATNRNGHIFRKSAIRFGDRYIVTVHHNCSWSLQRSAYRLLKKTLRDMSRVRLRFNSFDLIAV